MVVLIRHDLRGWGFEAAVPSVLIFRSFALRCVPCFDGLDRVRSCHLVDGVCALLLQRPNLSSGFVSSFSSSRNITLTNTTFTQFKDVVVHLKPSI